MTWTSDMVPAVGSDVLERDEWRQLIETLPQIVWITRPDGWHVHYNQRWMDFTGLTLEESLGFGWNPPFHPDDRGRAAARWAQATSTGEPYEIEYRLRRWDGTYRWMLGRAVPLRDATGTIVKWFGTCTDIEDLKQAQSQLEQSRTMQRLAGSMARLGGWTVDCAARTLDWSEEMYGILDQSPATPPQIEDVLRLFTPECQSRLVAAIEACASDGTRFDLDLELVTPAGRRLWVRVIGEAVYGLGGAVERITGAVQDVSDQKAASQRNQMLAERLTTTLESITDGFFTLDRDWRFTYVNSRAEELMRRDRSSLLGRELWAEFAPTLGTDLEFAYRRAMEQQETATLDGYHYPPLDTWFEITAYPSEQGLAVYFRDVGQEHRDRQALQERVKELRTLATISGATNSSTDADELCDLAARSLVDAMQHPGHVVAHVTLGHDVPALRSAPAGAVVFRTPVLVDGVQRGEIVVADLEGCAFLPEEEELIQTVAGTLGVWKGRYRATVELQRVNGELNVANAQLAAAAQLKDDLLSMASHELRTPLTPILGFAELLERHGDNLDERQRQMLGTIRRNARRMLGLVDDLLVISRAAADVLESRPEPVAVDHVVDLVREELGDGLADVEVEVGEGCLVHVDPQHLQQILANLLTNANKYGAPPFVVSASRGEDPGRVLVAVRDHGPGVPVEFQPTMWDRFTQKDRGDRRTAKGAGLGLAIVRLLAEKNGGSAHYRAGTPTGAVFVIDLPAAPS